MVHAKKVAIVGDGVVAGFASLAVQEAGFQPVILSRSGEFSRPPVGAFYLHDLPPSLREQSPELELLTTVQGDDPGSYTRRLWGKELPSSLDSFEPGQPTKEIVYPYAPEMTDAMFAGADVLISGSVSEEGVRQLAEDYERVIVTVPISFVGKLPRMQQFLTARTKQNRFFDAICESPVTVQERYGSPLLNSFAELQSAHPTLSRLAQRNDEAIHTVYSAEREHFWLRVTRHPGGVNQEAGLHLELVYDLFTADAWAQHVPWNKGKQWRLFQELRTSLSWARRDIAVQRKIHPEETLRNEAPADNVLLTGRWATWERGELSHETYARVSDWLAEER